MNNTDTILKELRSAYEYLHAMDNVRPEHKEDHANIRMHLDNIQIEISNAVLDGVSQRSELLKVEDHERSFDEYIEKYFSQPKIELVYKTLNDGKERTEKEIIGMYKQAHRL